MQRPDERELTYIKMNLGFIPRRNLSRDEILDKGSLTSVTAMSATKIDIRAKPRLTRSFSVTPTCGTSGKSSYRATYTNGYTYGRAKLSRNTWGSSPEPTRITDFDKMPEMKVSLKLIQVQAADAIEDPAMSSQANYFSSQRHSNPETSHV